MNNDTIKIYFIRHANSLAQERGIFDRADLGISNLGKRQAETLGAFLKTLPEFKDIDLYSSTQQRAMETAEILATYLDSQPKRLDLIREIEYPEKIRGKKRKNKNADAIYKEYKKKWLSGEALENLESFEDFKKRIENFYHLVLSLGKDSVFVSHEFFIKAFMSRVLFGKDFTAEELLSLYGNLSIDNCSVNGFEVLKDRIIIIQRTLKNDTITGLNKNKAGTEENIKVVTVGGGTGQYTLLKGLKEKDFDIKAIVSMADDGGTTGILRDELGVLPPSDLRKCIIALSGAEKDLRDIFAFRFYNKNLKGHTLGNLFISASEKVFKDLDEALLSIKKLFNLKGDVLPVSKGDMRLQVELKDGRVLLGESILDDSKDLRKVGLKKISLKKPARLSKSAKEAILKADYIIVGPGDLYGSILPNFLVSGMKSAVLKSKAKKIFIANLTNKKGQTDYFTVSDYLGEIQEYSGIEFDYILVNSEKIPKKLADKYKRKEGKGALLKCDLLSIKQKYPNLQIVLTELLSRDKFKKEKGDSLSSNRSFLRHDSKKLAEAIDSIIKEGQ